jgi:predicted PurR-regulated permease PerM
MNSGTDRPPVARLHIWQFQFVRDVLFIVAIAMLVWLGYLMRAVTVPLLVALLLAYLFEPLVSRLASHPRLNRPVVVAGLLCSVGVVFLLVMVIVISAVVSQTTRFIDEVREGRFQERIVLIRDYIPEEHRERAEEWFEWLFGPPEEDQPHDPERDGVMDDEAAIPAEETENEFAEQPTPPPDALDQPPVDRDEAWLRAIIRDEIERAGPPDHERTFAAPAIDWLGIARGGVGAVWDILLVIIQIGFIAFLIPFYFFFFSVWYPGIVAFFDGLIPSSKRSRSRELLTKMDNVIAGFVRGRIIVAIIMGIMFGIGWQIVGVPYAIVLGIITGIFCIVPFLGVIGVPIAVGLLFFHQLDPDEGLQMAWWAIILWPTVVFTVVQFIESYALTPIIAGKATNLDPVTMVVAVIAGGAIMGIYGMLLAIPVAACLKIIIMEVLLPKVRAWTEGRAADPLPIEE